MIGVFQSLMPHLPRLTFPAHCWELAGQAFGLVPDILRPQLHRDYLLILDHLHRSQSPEAGQYIELWVNMGARVGLSEAALRAERQTERSLVNEGMIGCGWLKCPMYEQEYAETFRCAGCRRAMYCDLSCQAR